MLEKDKNMEYFRLRQDRRYLFAPYMNTLKDILRRTDDLYIENGIHIPDFNSVFVSSDRSCDFISVLDQQIFLVKVGLKQVFSMYEPLLKFKQFFMFNNRRGEYCEYYAPILKSVDCISSQSKRNPYNGRIEDYILERERIGDESIFRLENAGERTVIIRLDVAESLLRRGLRDFCLEQIAQK